MPEEENTDNPTPEPEAEPTETPETEEKADSTPAPPSDEDIARAAGWKPESEHDGDKKPKTFLTAREFNLKGDLLKDIMSGNNKISDQKNEISELKKVVKGLGEHNKKVEEVGRKKAIAELKEKYKTAIENADDAEAQKIDKKMDDLHEQAQKKEEPEISKEEDQKNRAEILGKWQADNPWYASDSLLQSEMNMRATDISVKFPDKSLEEVLSEAEAWVKEIRPDKFKNPLREKGSAVESGSTGRKSKGMSYADMPKEQRAICDSFVKAGAMTQKQYVADYAKMEVK